MAVVFLSEKPSTRHRVNACISQSQSLCQSFSPCQSRSCDSWLQQTQRSAEKRVGSGSTLSGTGTLPAASEELKEGKGDWMMRPTSELGPESRAQDVTSWT